MSAVTRRRGKRCLVCSQGRPPWGWWTWYSARLGSVPVQICPSCRRKIGRGTSHDDTAHAAAGALTLAAQVKPRPP
jgi:hypothetical protein